MRRSSLTLPENGVAVGPTIRRFARAVAGLFQETLDTFGRNEPDVHAAAIAFAALFSLAPLIMLVLVIVGQAYQQQFYDRIVAEIAVRLGQDAANLLGGMIISRQGNATSTVAAVISLIVLISSSAGMVGLMRTSLESMWNLTARPQADVRRNIYVMAKQLVMPSAMALGLGLALSGVLVVNTLGSLLYDQYVQPFMAWLAVPAPRVGEWPAPLVNFVIFAAMFKFLPQARIRWRDVLPGAALTAVLFWLGNKAIEMYLAHLFAASVYGAAGSIIVVLLWLDYSALIVLFGAEFTYVYAKTYGYPIVPDADMMFKPSRSSETTALAQEETNATR